MNKAFKQFIRQIKRIEQDKDTFLRVARLERYESHREPLKPSDILKLSAIIGAIIICCVILILGYLSNNLDIALIGIGILAIIVGFSALIASGLGGC